MWDGKWAAATPPLPSSPPLGAQRQSHLPGKGSAFLTLVCEKKCASLDFLSLSSHRLTRSEPKRVTTDNTTSGKIDSNSPKIFTQAKNSTDSLKKKIHWLKDRLLFLAFEEAKISFNLLFFVYFFSYNSYIQSYQEVLFARRTTTTTDDQMYFFFFFFFFFFLNSSSPSRRVE